MEAYNQISAYISNGTQLKKKKNQTKNQPLKKTFDLKASPPVKSDKQSIYSLNRLFCNKILITFSISFKNYF